MSLKEQEILSQVKQIYDELIQEKNYHTKVRNQRQLGTEQSQKIKIPGVNHRNKEQES